MWVILGLRWVVVTEAGSGRCLTGHGFTGRSHVMVYRQLLLSNKSALELHSMYASFVSLCWVGVQTGGMLIRCC